MRRLMLVLSTAVVMGCAKKEEAPPETVAEPPAPVAPPRSTWPPSPAHGR
ncbi:MAG: hypothetical protein IPP98_07955 [Gemmatimonadetes bacterium]|nr:hypothetical protein [Gemmatimonadota bacterium]